MKKGLIPLSAKYLIIDRTKAVMIQEVGRILDLVVFVRDVLYTTFFTHKESGRSMRFKSNTKCIRPEPHTNEATKWQTGTNLLL